LRTDLSPTATKLGSQINEFLENIFWLIIKTGDEEHQDCLFKSVELLSVGPLRGAGDLPRAEDGPYARYLVAAGGGILVLRSGSREGFSRNVFCATFCETGIKTLCYLVNQVRAVSARLAVFQNGLRCNTATQRNNNNISRNSETKTYTPINFRLRMESVCLFRGREWS
jgi:hypothetical protein